MDLACHILKTPRPNSLHQLHSRCPLEATAVVAVAVTPLLEGMGHLPTAAQAVGPQEEEEEEEAARDQEELPMATSLEECHLPCLTCGPTTMISAHSSPLSGQFP